MFYTGNKDTFYIKHF